MQLVQFSFARFVLGELYQVAAFQEFAQAFLLVGQQPIRGLQFMQEFLRGAFRRVEPKSFFQISAQCVRDENAKRLGLRDECKGFRVTPRSYSANASP